MSEQHVFPDRLRHVLPREHGTRQYGAYDTVRRRGRTIKEDGKVKHNQGSIGATRIRKVCKPCNEGWLNTMEQECFPVVEQLLRGELTAITRADQNRLARIATSIAMVGEWVSKPHVACTQEEREHFRERLEPPPGWYVYLGRNISGKGNPAFYTDGCKSVENGIDGPKHYATYTMMMGSVLLHVFTFDPDEFFDVDLYATHLGLVSICPATDWIIFPAMPPLDATDIARVRAYARETWRKMVESH
jgi:hypothetical protein